PEPMAMGSSIRTVDAFPLTGQPRHKRVASRRLLADLISKRWMEGAVPLFLALLLSVVIIATTPGFSEAGNTELVFRELAEKGLIAIGLTVVMIAGGIDLSVGSLTGVVAMGSLAAMRALQWPVPVIIVASLLAGMALGAVNGFLIAKVKTKPFITTLVTLLVFRTVVQAIQKHYTMGLAFPRTNTMWSFLGDGKIAGIQTSLFIFLVVLVVTHLTITRARWGWWVTAVGSDRRSARRNGVPIDRVIFATYVVSGLLCGLAGLLLAARQGSTSEQVGTGYEIAALTAVVLGGVSLRGGRHVRRGHHRPGDPAQGEARRMERGGAGRRAAGLRRPRPQVGQVPRPHRREAPARPVDGEGRRARRRHAAGDGVDDQPRPHRGRTDRHRADRRRRGLRPRRRRQHVLRRPAGLDLEV